MTKGSDQAKVVLIAFSDFECPYCSRFAKDTLPALEEKYIATGRVRLAFRHMPIESIHPAAFKAAEATECAGQQGRFWEMHDRLFDQFKQLNQPQLIGHAKALALNVTAFEGCLKGAVTAKVRADAVLAAKLGVTGTPAFFVGQILADGRVKVTDRIVGARPVAAFEAALDRALGPAKP